MLRLLRSLALTVACLVAWPHVGAFGSTSICNATGLHAGKQYSGGSQQIPNACAFSPLAIPHLSFWTRSDLGITVVQGPVVATGTTPPTVTLTGTPTNTSQSTIVITITTPGILGVAIFSWSLNGVTQQTLQVTSASFPLGSTGITASFSAGTYAANNVYTSVLTVSAWADQSTSGANVVQATATKQPSFNPSGAKNRPYLGFSHATVTTLQVGKSVMGPTGWTMFAAFQLTAQTNNGSVLSSGSGGNGNEFHFDTGTTRDVLANAVAQRDDGATTTSFEIWVATNDGTTTLLWVNGSAQSLTNSTAQAVTSTAFITVGSANTGANSMDGNVYETGVYTTNLNAQQVKLLNEYMGALYGISVP